jgi:enoyl-CoA hydratase/carnithine racemase
MEEAHLLYHVDSYTCRITINRENQRNAITPEAIELFHTYLDDAEKNSDVRVLLITGAGDRAFCTGAQLGSTISGEGGDVFSEYARLLHRIYTFPKPTVAKVKGYCLAGGMGFMLACDIVVAGATSQFGTPEVNVGLWPMMIGALIFRNVPRKKAMEMILLGERISADRALEIGLITRVVPVENVDDETDTLCAKLAAKSPVGIRIGKTAFTTVESMSIDDALMFLSGKLAEVAGTEDAREGITAFMEKREPLFKGK